MSFAHFARGGGRWPSSALTLHVSQPAPVLLHRHGSRGAWFKCEGRRGNHWGFGDLESDCSVGLAGGMLGEKLCGERGVEELSDGRVVSSLAPRGWSR